MLTFKQARKIAEMRFGEPQNVYLAESTDRKTSLAVGWFRAGPRGGQQPRYAVRLGIVDGCALGGCCTFDDAEKAIECFQRYAEAPRERRFVQVREGRYDDRQSTRWLHYVVIEDARVTIVDMTPALWGGWNFGRVTVQAAPDHWGNMTAQQIYEWKERNGDNCARDATAAESVSVVNWLVNRVAVAS